MASETHAGEEAQSCDANVGADSDDDGHEAKRSRTMVSDDLVDLLSMLASAGANNPSGLSSASGGRPSMGAAAGGRPEPGTERENWGGSLSVADRQAALALSPHGAAGLSAHPGAEGAGGASTVGRTDGGGVGGATPSTSVASDAQDQGWAPQPGRKSSTGGTSGGGSAGWVSQQQAAQQQQALEQQARLARGSVKRAPTDPKPKSRRPPTDSKVSGGASKTSDGAGDDDDEGGDDRVRFSLATCLNNPFDPPWPSSLELGVSRHSRAVCPYLSVLAAAQVPCRRLQLLGQGHRAPETPHPHAHRREAFQMPLGRLPVRFEPVDASYRTHA